MGCVEDFPYQSGSGVEDSFSDRVARLLDRIDCRLTDSGEEREAIFRLRYDAYVRDQGIAPNSSERFSDFMTTPATFISLGCTSTTNWPARSAFTLPPKNIPSFPPARCSPKLCSPSSMPETS